jgi:2-(1,2-epoxy-1,2-dihydrophenyl)acetyl-CoA isomerase
VERDGTGHDDPLDGVRRVRIDNPEKRNALDDDTRARLLVDLEDAIADPTCDVILLSGAGGTICAGGDLPSMPEEIELIRARLAGSHRIVRLLVAGPKPVVAAVEGAAFGSGMALAAAADVVVAARGARFGCVFGRFALIPDSGLLWSLPQRVGEARARRLALTNAVLTGEEALALGLADHLCDDGGAEDAALAIAASIREHASPAVAATKALFALRAHDLDELLDLEMDQQSTLLAAEGFKARRDAFFGKRT